MKIKTCILTVTLLLTGCSTTPQQADRPALSTGASPGQQDPDLRQAAIDAYAGDDWEAAGAAYETLVRQYPAEAGYWYRLGNVYSFTDRLEAAVVCYRQALELDPDMTNAWLNLGMTQLKQAAYSFNNMQSRYPPDSTEAARAQRVVDGILGLLHSGE